MADDLYNVLPIRQSNTGGILVVDADQGPTLLTNLDSANTIYLHADGNAFSSTDQSGVFPLAPGAVVVIDNDVSTYAICAAGLTANLGIVPGGTHFFQPTSKITIPTGATTGQRIVIDGVSGTITMYDSGNNVTGIWSAPSQTFRIQAAGGLRYALIKINASGSPSINFNPDSSKYNDGFIGSGDIALGGGVFAGLTQVTSPWPLGGVIQTDRAVFEAWGRSTDGTTLKPRTDVYAPLEAGGEIWQTLPLDATVAQGSGNGVDGFRYRINALNELECDWDFKCNAVTGNISTLALATGGFPVSGGSYNYRVAKAHNVMCGQYGTVTLNGGLPHLLFATDGTISLQGIANTSVRLHGQCALSVILV